MVVAWSEATLKVVMGWGVGSLSPYLPITPILEKGKEK
jgi:hypothetical protein